MARGTQLGVMLDRLKAEARYAQDASLGQNFRATLVAALVRHQNRLWEDFDWRFLHVSRDKNMAAGQRLYNLPDDMTFERITKVQVKQGGIWFPSEDSLSFGIGGIEYTTLDSEANVRADPVLKWDMRDDNQFEVWPLPASNATTTDGIIRFWGIRNLKPIIQDSDVFELDDDMIVLYAAAEFLAGRGQKDAQAKLDQANSIYQRLRGGTTKHRGMIVVGGGEPVPARRPPLTIAPVWRSS